MEILKKENYRLHTLTDMKTGEQSVKQGLNIEKQTFNNSYYVICTIRYDKHEDDVYIDVVGDRLLDIADCDFKLFKDLIVAGKNLVKLANTKYSDHEEKED